MDVQGIHLVWIVVADLDAAVKFYTDVVGLRLSEISKEYRWAELVGPEGAILGIAEKNAHDSKAVGSDAVITLSVDNLQKALEEYKLKGGRLLGTVLEVEGHVKMQTVLDPDGNRLQIVEQLRV